MQSITRNSNANSLQFHTLNFKKIIKIGVVLIAFFSHDSHKSLDQIQII